MIQELDKKINMKRIIARESLILLAVVLIASSFYLISKSLYSSCFLEGDLIIMPVQKTSFILTSLGLKVVIVAYVSYLIIRFIIWALRSLKKMK